MNLRPIPYPADVRAKGWRFELDHERIRQSDTWALAPAEIRPWLLMLWMTAWEQVPCGSLPALDELIAARIGMPSKTFAKFRAVLMRGWWQAEDGRMYHDTLAQRVAEMVTTKEKERNRKSEYRKRMDAGRTPESHGGPQMSHGTDKGQTRDGHGDGQAESHGTDPGRDATGTGTGTTSSLRSEDKYPADFETVWLAYPKRPGASKAEAAKAWKARVKAGVEVAALQAGVERYAGYCKATGTAPQFIKHAATFFGPDEHYLSDWTVAALSAAAAGPAAVQRRADFFSQTTNTGDRHAEPDARTVDVEARAV